MKRSASFFAVIFAGLLLSACTLAPLTAPSSGALVPVATALPVLGSVGAPGVGDPIFPNAGNGGIDVQHYLLDVAWSQATGAIDATATLDILATQELSAFNLDFYDLTVDGVTVDGEPANYRHGDGELQIFIPERTLFQEGQSFQVVIDYSGVPQAIRDPSLGGASIGWLANEKGVVVVSEPTGSPTWYPVNDHPSDKARYTFRVTAPKPYVAAANGTPVEPVDNGDTVTYEFISDDEMASYLATVDIWNFRLETQEGPDGLPILNYIPATLPQATDAVLGDQPAILQFFSDLYGPYPFDSAGAIVVDRGLGFSLETQTRPVYDSLMLFMANVVVPHELAHQWFGDSVTLAEWDDIWLNEGFATYSQMLWLEHEEGPDALAEDVRRKYLSYLDAVILPKKYFVTNYARRLSDVMGSDARFDREQVGQALTVLLGDKLDQAELQRALDAVPDEGLPVTGFGVVFDPLTFDAIALTPGKDVRVQRALGNEDALPPEPSHGMEAPNPPGVVDETTLFSTDGVYNRGALTLHALRALVGDETFFEIMRTYYGRYQYANASTADFIAVAEEVSGQNLDDFFNAWLYEETLPPIPGLELGVDVGG
jgi:aminopeptidase N